MGQRPPIIINRLDAERLQRLIDQAPEKDQMVAELLEEELLRGEVLDPQDIPDNVVSMNSQIRFTDLTRGRQMIRTLVYPHALASVEDGISVMAPIGAALIGLKVGDVIEWPLPNATDVKLRVDAIFWQPEREKQFHR
ncbi:MULTISPECIES: nucleoside diphosphate kinase regulator [Halomonadaceae]|jgi:regulator of nucleoside diphosphate kinase|uniref:Regulator of nucleoside diphosphate kinase n=2 Tax=Halomonadaceae TaxID=28256 RepID=A0A8H9I4Q0_9GAMM|nr:MULTISPECIES: nucleoside diphosphate kinase regulator [Halomonas]ATH79367.1 nucleoside diphosphate kinase regulator [Halomonas hydrothermalis]KHJ49640.1 nucleoside diphosphate kinase regulator [Halomonas hydrothermalis]UDM08450.1 nucleoside diphosphate kinase regulator [Halomonas sp. NyZ770]GGW33308.1 regulator of nucleoside diphosphate kinase [Halomonas hamiltonii]GGW67627.1 regulator of nucleoside diphosphate kinase [Halomonas johnsoniae]|tara:strand:+ start:999 stop:1412 length:414 start_codon:yes stop_codon:yes gene_type:complete